jgi:hypothetical protein
MPNYPYSFQLPPLNVQDIPNDGAVGEFLGISAGGVLDWLPVSAGGGDMLKSENLSGLASYPTARTNLGLGTTDSPTFKNLVIATGSIATSAPVTISQTWAGTGSTVFTALKVVATDTASGATSNLLELWSGSTAALKLSVRKGGQILGVGGSSSVPTYSFAGDATTGIYSTNSGQIYFVGGGLVYAKFAGGLTQAADQPIRWAATIDAAGDVFLFRDGPNTLALRNGAAAQTFNVYGTYTSGSAYARLAIACDTSGNATLTTQSTGTAGTVSINGVPVGLGKGNISSNVAVGTGALNTNATGTDNVAVGFEALGLGTGPFESVAVGWRAAKGASFRHVSIGYGANQLGANDSVSIGWASMFNLVSGSLNVAVGRSAGYFISGGSTSMTSCTKSLFLGCDTKALGQGQENQIVIGYDATGLGSNTAVLGNSSITTTALRGNVGIGTTAPASGLHVAGALGSNTTTYDSAAALKLSNTTDGSSWLLTAGIIGVLNGSFSIRPGAASLPSLVISNTGNVGIGTTAPSSKLHVVGDASISGNISLSNGSVTVLGARGFTLTPGDGIFQFLNNAQTGFDRIQLGGASTGHPAIKRNGASIDITLASDGITFTSIQDLYRRFGAGSPEGVVIAPTGAVYHNTSGGAATTFYVKESSPTPSTGWVGK